MTKNPEHIAWDSHWAHLQRAEAPRSRLIPILIKSAYSVVLPSRFAAWARADSFGPKIRRTARARLPGLSASTGRWINKIFGHIPPDRAYQACRVVQPLHTARCAPV
ncbi:hypothetical protein [Corynebacterium sp. KPL2838]|uniref:hypothetical protein n=1 Tax=unclassified Corynebacterium TaxID=2624378 RepID=UPI0032EEB71D